MKPGRPPRPPNRRRARKVFFRGGLEAFIRRNRRRWAALPRPTERDFVAFFASLDRMYRDRLWTAPPTAENTTIDMSAPHDPDAPHILLP